VVPAAAETFYAIRIYLLQIARTLRTVLLSEQFYVESAGGMLEATGRLYADSVRVYVQPMSCKNFRSHLDSVGLAPDWVSVPKACESGDSESVTLHNIEFSGPTRLLHLYLIESGWVEQLSNA